MEAENNTYHVLMIDDDENLCGVVSDFMGAYGLEVQYALDGNDGLQMALSSAFDAILLDMMLPDIDGLTILKQLRAKAPKLPVIIISAQTDVSDKIVGLEMGADDYVPKTFAPRELLARLRAVLRRSRTSAEDMVEEESCDGETVVIHGLMLDSTRMQADLNGKTLDLSTIEFQLLYRMASHPGRVFSRDQLISDIFGREYCIFDRSVDMHISSLRRKLGDSPRTPSYLRTVRGSGYMFMK
ncbi:two component transcriptional regulator, winged helix family [Pseudodesulfovibrio mercurii]|uniref:Two component transcriptional regulator, winged helix family n=1 Tax=Pseudodesulfovibrio mercurii TaxID=641491 RepID=F0JBQ1_9BACT|nr:response regulator transcription factor [Pseudodesulfovibrio mercurii]EGB15554.1 two component transcriptional regulator, winged helix family [Pseudodesulfovibrio mercurii]